MRDLKSIACSTAAAATLAIAAHAASPPEPQAGPLLRRALNQAAREVLLAESSDWPFIMKTGTVTQYATKRVKSHVMRFEKIEDFIRRGEIDEEWLDEVEKRDAIFPDIDYRVYARHRTPFVTDIPVKSAVAKIKKK